MKGSLGAVSISRQAILREVKDYLFIVLGIALYSIGWAGFFLPSKIPTGAVPGIATIVEWGTEIPAQFTYLSINGVLLIIGLMVLGKRFILKTIFGVLVLGSSLTLARGILENQFFEITSRQPFMACVIGACFCGAGLGLAFSSNGSTGGMDIVAAVINKYRDVSLGRVILLTDLVIISSSYVVLHNWNNVVYGLVGLVIMSYVLDLVVNSTRRSVQFFIISKKYEEIAKQINTELHRGVTYIDGVGAYTNNDVKMMFVLAKRRESTTIFRLIQDIDPTAFVSQSAVIGVFGEGFDKIKVKQQKKKVEAS